ncbi:aldo/keto reductase [Candidatus Desantisbacteria bacterium CG_4_10_14_0_8_um_filter_48_22]|uniref:Aldo/keto reductase n=1 Tax=Candidatus Desantisbacteria bacterium CG_4_10_14_0_8_um_filter_48_22 TaxID=1974543 RepID=A0A2M7S4V1_9BACT|nr:MAG: hypothetical protein AUJ67_08195 [Candidatus Desantisbacteria bacterium CG1_02_49_89]PIV56488.1 MAG: aldo/keto reductase [Candidatus Desantisbacteria bacterium CG02_land_8_20_14_3_00_49_13]PIZ14601.1 MAG: aldo/keto reductase [Candidatus Desantisbacteria bacterium CG_4_10_14_0_8_um_filter_48_22]PJB27694.1 MAG: aldo/keto reductase [Candidatus Desantisbacteria bacterium CG_4_9_14_3_um_filter_50_7]
MQYRDFGKTGLKISALGFGAMRLPNIMNVILEDEAIAVIQRAFDLGVNFLDTAFVYGESELVCGKALKKYPRDKIIVSSKNPMWDKNYTDTHWRRKLELSLKRMQLSYFDIYAVWHDVRMDAYLESKKVENNWLKEALKAKKEGILKHLIISCHDTPENMIKLFEEGYLEGMILQYNLLDRVNEKVIEYAHNNGLGIAVMGPVAGGKLGSPSPEIQGLIPGGSKSTAELALRFVLSNQGVSTAMSGMNTVKMVEENCAVASSEKPLSEKELKGIQAALDEKKKLADLYCTDCKYCMPCPNRVNIPANFSAMNSFRLYGLKEHAKHVYKHLTERKASAEFCKECKKCEEKCPQKIKISEQLKEVALTLKETA